MPYPFYPYQSYPQNQQPIPQTPQVQTPFVNVRSEAEARNFPVGFGNVVCFKDENEPYIYTKAMGFSQSDKPVFEKYRKESEEETNKFEDLETQIKEMQKDINFLKERRNEHNGNGKSVQTKPNGDVVKKI